MFEYPDSWPVDCIKYFEQEMELLEERAKRAEEKADIYCKDWYEAKQQFGDAAVKLRQRIRELENNQPHENPARTAYVRQLEEALFTIATERGCNCKSYASDPAMICASCLAREVVKETGLELSENGNLQRSQK